MNETHESLMNWLEGFLSGLPKKKKPEKSFYDIARFPRRENVISNVMQFYFEDQDHGFGRLFFDALLQCLLQEGLINEESMQEYNSPYTVQREFKNIDILIKDNLNKWAIIIEHKVDHWLNNPLDRYWNSVQAENKILVVLSLQEILMVNTDEEMKFINITYKKFTDELDLKLNGHTTIENGRHQYFINDFVKHLKKLIQMSEPNVEIEKSLKLFQANIEKVNEVYNLRNKVKDYLISQLSNSFAKIGFLPYFKSRDRAWEHFLVNDLFFERKNIPVFKGFRFFVDIDKLFEKNTLELFFEICGEDVQHGELLRDYLLRSKLINEPLSILNEVKDDYVHLVGYTDFVLDDLVPLQKQFEKLLVNVFLKDDGNGLLKICGDWVKKQKVRP